MKVFVVHVLLVGYGGRLCKWMNGSNGFVPTITEKVSAQQIYEHSHVRLRTEFASTVK